MSSQQAVLDDPVEVEVLAFRVTGQGTLAYRKLAGALGGGWHPDQVARDLLGLSPRASAYLLHSTSWRHEEHGQVVLTYACCPDPEPHLPARPLRVQELARGDGPASPSPEIVQIEQVAAHAIRHLAFLMHNDPDAGRVIASIPGFPELVARWTPAPAGQLPY